MFNFAEQLCRYADAFGFNLVKRFAILDFETAGVGVATTAKVSSNLLGYFGIGVTANFAGYFAVWVGFKRNGNADVMY